MKTDRFITSSCLITRNKIFKDGVIVLEQEGMASDFLNACYDRLKISYPKFHKMDNLCKLGILATEVLLGGALVENKFGDRDTGLVLCNASASLDVDLRYEKTIRTGASPALFVYTLPNIVIGEISIRHHIRGENAFFVFKQFDTNFIAGYVNNLFENRLIRNCICGWVEYLKEEYRAILFFVESENPGKAIPFTAANLNQLNQTEYE